MSYRNMDDYKGIICNCIDIMMSCILDGKDSKTRCGNFVFSVECSHSDRKVTEVNARLLYRISSPGKKDSFIEEKKTLMFYKHFDDVKLRFISRAQINNMFAMATNREK